MGFCKAHRLFIAGWLFLSIALFSGASAEPWAQQEGYLSTFQSADTTSAPTAEGDPYRVFHLEFDSAASALKFDDPAFTVFNRSGRFADIFAPPTDEALEKIANLSGLVWLDYNRTIKLPPAPQAKPVGATRASEEKVVRDGVDGYRGKGVTVAIVDSGFDVRHPDFQTVSSEGKIVSRFRAIWDTTEMRPGLGKPAPIRYPNGQPIGVIYSRDDINTYLNTAPDQRPEIAWDGSGHGTSCAGIAAGNGSALEGTPYAGVASQADLIGIRMGDDVRNSYLVTALLHWLDDEAGSRPLVISNSWGGARSGHDGSSLIERQIDERFSADRAGRLVLFAAGNEGEVGLHAGGDFAGADKPGILKLPNQSEGDEVEVTVYFDTDDETLTTKAPMEFDAYVHGLTGQMVWRFQPTTDHESIELFSKAGKKAHFDAYIAGTIAEQKAVFEPSAAVYRELVNNPGNAENVLTVGSYDFNPFFERQGEKLVLGVGEEFGPMSVGDISGYSSPGFTRLGRLKPDFTAPGQWWTASAPLANEELIRDTSGLYNLFNGTSAATPYAAGVMALLLEKNPQLTLNQVRALLDRHLKADTYTGSLPNPTWGRGKLTVRAVQDILNDL